MRFSDNLSVIFFYQHFQKKLQKRSLKDFYVLFYFIFYYCTILFICYFLNQEINLWQQIIWHGVRVSG